MNFKTLLAAYNFIKSIIETLEKDDLRDTLSSADKATFMNWMSSVTNSLRDVITCQPELANLAKNIIESLSNAYKAGHIDSSQQNTKRSVQKFISLALNTGDLNSLVDQIEQSWKEAEKELETAEGYVNWGNVLVDKNAAVFINRVIN